MEHSICGFLNLGAVDTAQHVRRDPDDPVPYSETNGAVLIHILEELFQHLGQMEITSLMIEGGAKVNWAALSAGIVDKVFFYYAPRILAGSASVPLAAGAGFASIGDAACVKSLRLHRFGEDFAVEGYLKDPYTS